MSKRKKVRPPAAADSESPAGPAPPQRSPGTPPAAQRSRGSRWLYLLLIVVASATVVFGVIWRQEAPLRQAEAELEANDMEAAARRLSRFLEQHPDHGRALLLQARVMVAKGEAERAVEVFETVGPTSPEDFHAMARAFMLMGQWSNALPLLTHVAQQQPRNADALYELTSCRVRIGRFVEALDSAEQFAAIPGNEARGFVYLGSIHNDLANREKAAEMFGKVLEHSPDANDLQVTPSEFFVQYGRTLLAIGDVARAATMAQRAIAIEPSGDAYELAAQCWQQQGNPEAAVDAWTQALEQDPGQVEARLGLANDALQRRDHQAALDILKPVATSNSVNAAVSFAVQRALTLAGETEEAENWRVVTERLRKAEERDAVLTSLLREQPDSYWAKVVRAYRFAEQGNLQQARMLVQAVMSQGDPEEFVSKLDRSLREGSALPSLDELPLGGDQQDSAAPDVTPSDAEKGSS